MPISGAVLDHLGTRSALIAGPALGCTAGLIAAGVPWFGLILLLVFFMGVAESIWMIAREVAGIDLARQDQRGRVLSGFHGVNNVGLALGPLFGGLLTESLGFRAAFIGYTTCAAASVVIGFSVRPQREKDEEKESPHRRRVRGAFLLNFSLRSRRLCGEFSETTCAWAQRWNFAAFGRWLRGLRQLFHQIYPQLRSTYAVIVLATFTSFVHRS